MENERILGACIKRVGKLMCAKREKVEALTVLTFSYIDEPTQVTEILANTSDDRLWKAIVLLTTAHLSGRCFMWGENAVIQPFYVVKIIPFEQPDGVYLGFKFEGENRNIAFRYISKAVRDAEYIRAIRACGVMPSLVKA